MTLKAFAYDEERKIAVALMQKALKRDKNVAENLIYFTYRIKALMRNTKTK